MIKINKRQLNKWIRTLYAGEFEQGQNELQDNSGGYCCLGVACVVLIPTKKLAFETGTTKLEGAMPREQQNAPDWLKKIDSDFQSKTASKVRRKDSILNSAGYSLASLNDDGIYPLGVAPLTHPEIAMLLDLVYNYKMLD